MRPLGWEGCRCGCSSMTFEERWAAARSRSRSCAFCWLRARRRIWGRSFCFLDVWRLIAIIAFLFGGLLPFSILFWHDDFVCCGEERRLCCCVLCFFNGRQTIVHDVVQSRIPIGKDLLQSKYCTKFCLFFSGSLCTEIYGGCVGGSEEGGETNENIPYASFISLSHKNCQCRSLRSYHSCLPEANLNYE